MSFVHAFTLEDGDIVVQEHSQDGRCAYELRTAPGLRGAIRYRSRDEAVAQAVAVARRQRVRVWLKCEGHEITLVDDSRVDVESV